MRSQSVNEMCLDGGKVRLRTQQQGQPCEWRDYKAARLSGIYYGATCTRPSTADRLD